MLLFNIILLNAVALARIPEVPNGINLPNQDVRVSVNREQTGGKVTYFVAWLGDKLSCSKRLYLIDWLICAHGFRLDDGHPQSSPRQFTSTPAIADQSPETYDCQDLFIRTLALAATAFKSMSIVNIALPKPRNLTIYLWNPSSARMAPLPKTMRAVVCAETGDIDVLKLQDIPIPTPASGQVLLKILGFGINRAGTCHFRVSSILLSVLTCQRNVYPSRPFSDCQVSPYYRYRVYWAHCSLR